MINSIYSTNDIIFKIVVNAAQNDQLFYDYHDAYLTQVLDSKFQSYAILFCTNQCVVVIKLTFNTIHHTFCFLQFINSLLLSRVYLILSIYSIHFCSPNGCCILDAWQE